MNLYEMTNDLAEIMEIPEEEMTPEVKAEIQQAILDAIQNKGEGIIAVIRNYESRIDAVKAEEKRLAEYRKPMENKVKRLREYTKECLLQANLTKVETNLGRISIRKSPDSVEVTDINKIPNIYKIKEETVKVDKKTLKDFLQKGHKVDGAVLVQDNYGIIVK